jgi:hypothetical protein
MVFLYRHYVELMLKSLIFAFNEPAVRRITGSAELGPEDFRSLRRIRFRRYGIDCDRSF